MTSYELTHFKKMVWVWKMKSLLFCLRYNPLIAFRRQNHITFIFIKTMSHDLLVQMAYKVAQDLFYICKQKTFSTVSSINLSKTDKALPIKSSKPNFLTCFVYFGNSLFDYLWNFFVCYGSKPGSHFAHNLRIHTLGIFSRLSGQQIPWGAW